MVRQWEKGGGGGGEGRRGRQKMKRWEDNTKEWTGQEFANSQRAVGDRNRGGELVGGKVVSGAPTIRTGYGENVVRSGRIKTARK